MKRKEVRFSETLAVYTLSSIETTRQRALLVPPSHIPAMREGRDAMRPSILPSY